MAYDRAEYERLSDQRKRDARDDKLSDLRRTAMAMVPAQKLTNDPGWDVLLQAIQAQILRANTRLSALNEFLCDPEKLNHDEIILAKVRAANCQGLITALEMVSEFPKEFIARGTEALEILKNLGDS